jgi:hypothetical protein
MLKRRMPEDNAFSLLLPLVPQSVSFGTEQNARLCFAVDKLFRCGKGGGHDHSDTVEQCLVRRGGIEALTNKHRIREIINGQRRLADDPLLFTWRQAETQFQVVGQFENLGVDFL